MGSEYWIAECVDFAGGEMVHGYPGGHSQTLEKIDLLSIAEHIITSPCGFGIERTYEELGTLKILESKEWLELPGRMEGFLLLMGTNISIDRALQALAVRRKSSQRVFIQS